MADKVENRVKIGAKVNESVYAEFKKHVHDKTGQKRGVLGEAVEAALRQYMDDTSGDIDGDVSNADLLREIRALQNSDETPAPHPSAEESDSDAGSTDSPGSDESSSPSSSDDTPAPPPGNDKGALEDSAGEKPPLNAPPGERAGWIADNIGIQGRVSFDTLVKEVGRQYPQQSDSTCRDLAWKWAAFRAPAKDEFPDESEYPESSDGRLDEPASDSYLRDRSKAREDPVLMTCPRMHENGAWFKIEETCDGVLNHQEPTERGDVVVYLGAGGARAFAEELGFIDSDSTESSGFLETSDRFSDESGGSDESNDSGESGEVESEDFEDVDIDGASDSSVLDEEDEAVLDASSVDSGSD